MNRPAAAPGDRLLVWLGGAGDIAEATVIDRPRIPSSRQEAPWPGGTYRFKWIVPIDVMVEPPKPVKFGFQGDRQALTGFSKSMFLRSFARIDDAAALIVSDKLRASTT